MMTFISMRLAYIRRSISFVDRFSIQRSFYYFAHSIQLIDRYIELLLLLDPRPNLLAYTSFSTQFSVDRISCLPGLASPDGLYLTSVSAFLSVVLCLRTLSFQLSGKSRQAFLYDVDSTVI